MVTYFVKVNMSYIKRQQFKNAVQLPACFFIQWNNPGFYP